MRWRSRRERGSKRLEINAEVGREVVATPPVMPRCGPVNRLLMFIGMTVGGYVGWWAGDYMGFGLMGTFLVSSVGSLIGVYVAWRVLTEYLS